jgi:hypothetical protein
LSLDDYHKEDARKLRTVYRSKQIHILQSLQELTSKLMYVLMCDLLAEAGSMKGGTRPSQVRLESLSTWWTMSHSTGIAHPGRSSTPTWVRSGYTAYYPSHEFIMRTHQPEMWFYRCVSRELPFTIPLFREKAVRGTHTLIRWAPNKAPFVTSFWTTLDDYALRPSRFGELYKIFYRRFRMAFHVPLDPRSIISEPISLDNMWYKLKV